jgi:hypothetical protein
MLNRAWENRRLENTRWLRVVCKKRLNEYLRKCPSVSFLIIRGCRESSFFSKSFYIISEKKGVNEFAMYYTPRFISPLSDKTMHIIFFLEFII